MGLPPSGSTGALPPSGTSLRISTRGTSRGGLRPGSSISSTKSEEYIACASCHRQRSKFSDFCNVCVKKMDARRKDNASQRRAIWSREGKSATFLLELSGTTGNTYICSFSYSGVIIVRVIFICSFFF